MIIKPKVRGFVCVTAHPEGCAAHVREQIRVVRQRGPLLSGPRKVLVLGASTGYGLATRIVSAFGAGAATLGVFYERPGSPGKPASPGWYNSAAFEREAKAAGLWARSVNGDAFSSEIKAQTVGLIARELGSVDLVVYSLASPRRVDPVTGEVYRSVLKPIGRPYHSKNLDTDRHQVTEVTVDPASEEEILHTCKVMGGEDWQLWMEALRAGGVLAPDATAVAYDYIGPEVTWPVYTNGTIGQAKRHLRQTAERLNSTLGPTGGRAFISVNKAVVTQASSAIPVVPLYISLLFKVMKEKGLHEDCIQQMDRLFRDFLYAGSRPKVDDEGRLRLDDLEMREDVQRQVAALWDQVSTENLDSLADYQGYREDFLRLFGFGFEEIDYSVPVDPEVSLDP